MSRTLSVAVERFPIAGTFTISRGAKTEAVVVTATISDGKATGRGECVPYARYGESVDSVTSAIESATGLEPVATDKAGANAPAPSESRTERVLSPLLAVAKSNLPSPLKSPLISDQGLGPTSRDGGD